LWRIFATFRKAARVDHLALSLLGLVGMGWAVHILVESIAYPVFVTAPTSPMLFGLAAITYVILTSSPPAQIPSEEGAPTADADAEPPGRRAGTVARVAGRTRRPEITRWRGSGNDSVR
jgi:hypothetical protein